MAQKRYKTGGDIASRAFAALWRRRAAHARDPAALARVIEMRRAALAVAAKTAAARAARGRAADAAGPDEVWRFRPEAFERPLDESAFANPPTNLSLGPDLKIFHDAPAWEGGAPQGPLDFDPTLYALSQRRAGGPRGAALAERGGRFELFFESYEFAGDYLSFVLSAPSGLRRPEWGERLRLSLDIVATRPLKAFFRLNHEGAGGAGVLYAEGEVGGGAARFEFDPALAAAAIGAEDVIWLETLIDRPRMVEIAVRDLSLSLVGVGAE